MLKTKILDRRGTWEDVVKVQERRVCVTGRCRERLANYDEKLKNHTKVHVNSVLQNSMAPCSNETLHTGIVSRVTSELSLVLKDPEMIYTRVVGDMLLLHNPVHNRQPGHFTTTRH